MLWFAQAAGQSEGGLVAYSNHMLRRCAAEYRGVDGYMKALGALHDQNVLIQVEVMSDDGSEFVFTDAAQVRSPPPHINIC